MILSKDQVTAIHSAHPDSWVIDLCISHELQRSQIQGLERAASKTRRELARIDNLVRMVLNAPDEIERNKRLYDLLSEP
jgi:hypothetical protein